MKKYILIAMSLLLLTACSGKASDSSSDNISQQETAAAETTEPTEEKEKTTNAPMLEIKVEKMTVKLDPAVWETSDEYIKRKEESGSPLSAEDIADLKSFKGKVFVQKDTDSLLWFDAFPFEIAEASGTKEAYELLSEAFKYSAENSDNNTSIRSKVVERNGLMFLDSISYASGGKTHFCTILKDDMQYSFLFAPFTSKSKKEIIYDLIDNATFE